MTYEQGQKIQNFDGLDLKIAILYFFSAVTDSAWKNFALSPTVIKKINFKTEQNHF